MNLKVYNYSPIKFSIPVPPGPALPAWPSGYMTPTTNNVSGYNAIRAAIDAKPRIVSSKSDLSIINILNASFKKNPDRTKSGGRANSVFQEASQYCLAGVDIDSALSKLKDIYGPKGAGLCESEVEYQACRGYEVNIYEYGKNRNLFDGYGSGNKPF